MVFKSYRVQLIIRLLLIVLNCYLILYAFNQEQWYVTRFSLILVLIFQSVRLIKYHETWIMKLNYLMDLIQVNDFSYTFSNSKKSTGSLELEKNLDRIMNHFRSLKIDKETHYQYLLTVLEHNQTPTICFDEQGKIHLSNRALQNLFGKIPLIHIDKLNLHYPELSEILLSKDTANKKLIKLQQKNGSFDYSISLTDFCLKEKRYRLCSFYNISTELENQELESYHKLSRVMTHEVMNSLTPVSTLSSALNNILEEYQEDEVLDPEDFDDLKSGLNTIAKRSKSLAKLIKDYKHIHQLPPLHFELIPLNDLLQHLSILMKQELASRNINFTTDLQISNQQINVDHDQFMQVLINLLTNSIQALQQTAHPSIELGSKILGQQTHIWIKDNGSGMDQETLDNIFVPFFTTKKQGAGIGLSISREIIRKHQGQINVQSKEGDGSCFTIIIA